jgi:hypothetical protein
MGPSVYFIWVQHGSSITFIVYLVFLFNYDQKGNFLNTVSKHSILLVSLQILYKIINFKISLII